MELYRGSEDEVRVQRKVARETSWIQYSQGAAHAGHRMATDNPDQFGWGPLLEHLHEDQSFGFRLVAVGEVLKIRRRLAGEGFRVDIRDSFIGDRDQITAASTDLANTPLPSGLRYAGREALADESLIGAAMDCIAGCGIRPFPGAMLSGESVDSVTTLVLNEAGGVVATAFAQKAHNQYSEHKDHVFLGQLCVAEGYRRAGIGRTIAARTCMAALSELKAGAVYADIDESDMGARLMVELCGMVIDGGLQNGEAVPGRIRV